jgi:MFS family permease
VKFRGISRNVIALGWVSFFTDLASEALYPVMPLFLVGTLGASPAILGLVDGLAEGISSGLRWLGGALSDRFARRKPFVFLGYGISAISKPVMGLAQLAVGWPMFLIGRTADRFGKSLRTAARDALIADSTEAQFRGKAFGLHRAMDTCGAILGPLMTLLIVAALAGIGPTLHARWNGAGTGAIAKLPLGWLFLFAVVPGLISSALVLISVREIRPTGKTEGDAPGRPGRPAIFQSFPRPFWHLIIANAVFSLANSSDSFLLLRSGELGLGFASVVLVYALYNAVYAAAATPLGNLSDRIGRKPILACGWIVYAIVYGGLALWHSAAAPWVLLAIYGLYQALSEGVSKAMVSDLVPSHQRAGAIGLFYTVSGFGQLLASLLAGAIWNVRPGGMVTALGVGAVFALLGAAVASSIRVTKPE